jgi:hypothetical protein
LIGLFALVALAVDIGLIAVARSQCQNAADSAAMAGARTFNGNGSTTVNFNYDQVAPNAVAAAVANKILGQNVQGDPNTDWNPTDPVLQAQVHPSADSYQTGEVLVELGSYVYQYNDANPSKEGFVVKIPRDDPTTQPWSAVRATITHSGPTSFARVLGMNAFPAKAVSVAAHRPRDIAIIMDLSGSMRFQSLPGTPMSGSLAAPSSNNIARTKSLNPETVFPTFGHYSDQSGAALQGTAAFATTTNEYVDPCNISSTANSGPPIAADFYKNPVGTALTSTNQSSYEAFSRAPDSQAATPGGDDYLKTGLDTGSSYAKTVADFNNGSTTTNVSFETQGYQSVRSAFNLYTEGPGYWGKTFFIWPPAPRGPNVLNPPASLTDTSYNWYNNQSNDWRQRFFVAVNTATSAPSWVNHNTILFDNPSVSGAPLKKPGSNTVVTENGVAVTYTFRYNYAAILYWLQNIGPANRVNPFPPTLQAGRIRYYSAQPDPTDNSLNNRWWTTNPTSLPQDEQFWKAYIDFVLGTAGTGAGAYNLFQNGIPYTALIGNGDMFSPAGSTYQVSQRPQPQPPANTPGAPYQTAAIDKPTGGAYPANTTQIKVKNLAVTVPASPVVNKDYVVIGANTTPYLVTGFSSTTSTITISPGLKVAGNDNDAVKFFSPYMDYNDNPMRPRHQLWFGPMTFLDWLGNYNTNKFWWPGNVHEAHAWACKVGIQTAIQDIKNNHPSDFLSLMYFSSPKYSAAGSGHHNRAVVSMGRKYQQMIDSLWFPPNTVTGTATEISPYVADMDQVPRANGGTAPGMGFMLAFNQLSSSETNLRAYASPQPLYRGDAGGLGRKGANRLVIFETDGAPNTRAYAALAGSGADSFYPIRISDPTNLGSASNTEWPAGGAYSNQEVYDVASQICAMNTATPPGFSTGRKPALIHCIGYGSIFDPANSGATQNNALGFLQQIQYIGNTQSSASTVLPDYKRIYGPNQDRIEKMRQAFTNIMQAGVQVSLIE